MLSSQKEKHKSETFNFNSKLLSMRILRSEAQFENQTQIFVKCQIFYLYIDS